MPFDVQPQILFSVFTKPWKTLTLAQLASRVKEFGFDAVELPVRPGYQVVPERIQQDLPLAAQILGDNGIKIASVAGPTDEAGIAACAASGVPVIRICEGLREGGYLASEAEMRREYEELLPLLERYGVTLGIQNHCGESICNAMGLRSLLSGFDRRYVAAVWDAAHNALDGEPPEMAVDIVWDHLCMVNLKNAFWKRVNGPEAEVAEWEPYWTSGPQGLAHWPRVVKELKRRRYTGVVCLTAEYTDEDSVDRLIAQDIVFARRLFSGE